MLHILISIKNRVFNLIFLLRWPKSPENQIINEVPFSITIFFPRYIYLCCAGRFVEQRRAQWLAGLKATLTLQRDQNVYTAATSRETERAGQWLGLTGMDLIKSEPHTKLGHFTALWWSFDLYLYKSESSWDSFDLSPMSFLIKTNSISSLQLVLKWRFRKKNHFKALCQVPG